MSIGSNIKNLRVAHDLTQSDLGRIAGVTDKAVSSWESDAKVPRMGAVQRIADYFSVPKSAILDDSATSPAPVAYNSNPTPKPASDYAPRLRELREKRGLTLDQVAAALGLRNQYVSNYELGKRRPDYDTLSKFADFYHVSTDYLLGHDKTAPETEGGLTPEDKFFLENVGKLTPDQRAFLAAQIKVLLEGQK